MDLIAFLLPQVGVMLFLLLLAKLIAGKADVERGARTDGARTFYEPNRRSFWGVYLFVGAAGYAVVSSLFRIGTSTVALAVSSIGVGFILFLLMAFPATIVADENGLEQIFWLRGRKRIAWNEIRKFAVDPKSGELRIAGKTGVKIVHTRQLPDRDLLLADIQKHGSEYTLVMPPIPVETEVVAGAPAASKTSAA